VVVKKIPQNPFIYLFIYFSISYLEFRQENKKALEMQQKISF
jgi:hypothetical protein